MDPWLVVMRSRKIFLFRFFSFAVIGDIFTLFCGWFSVVTCIKASKGNLEDVMLLVSEFCSLVRIFVIAILKFVSC